MPIVQDKSRPEQPADPTNYSTHAPIFVPQGRLTTVSGVLNPGSDQINVTKLYYSGKGGAYLPIVSGGIWRYAEITELSLELASSPDYEGYHQAGKNFDVVGIFVNGQAKLGTVPAWTVGINGTDNVRGIGVGSSEQVYQNGLIVCKYPLTVRIGKGANDKIQAVPGSQITHIGSIRTTANGQTEDSLANRFVCDTWNPIKKDMFRQEPTFNWFGDGANVWRQANGNILNKLNFLQSQAGQPVRGVLNAMTTGAISAGVARMGIALNATNKDDSKTTSYGAPDDPAFVRLINSLYSGVGLLGLSNLSMNEISAVNTTKFYGVDLTNDHFRCGLWAEVFV